LIIWVQGQTGDELCSTEIDRDDIVALYDLRSIYIASLTKFVSKRGKKQAGSRKPLLTVNNRGTAFSVGRKDDCAQEVLRGAGSKGCAKVPPVIRYLLVFPRIRALIRRDIEPPVTKKVTDPFELNSDWSQVRTGHCATDQKEYSI
jgi:hypothetical protein